MLCGRRGASVHDSHSGVQADEVLLDMYFQLDTCALALEVPHSIHCTHISLVRASHLPTPKWLGKCLPAMC